MPYLIDGHNLIPKIAGLSLSNPDDEQRLIELLQVFCRVRRQKVEVFFDGSPPGHAGRQQAGTVVVHFVSQGRTADEAITARLDQLGKVARNWTVVSSDRQVQREAQSRHAAVMPSEQFAGELRSVLLNPHAGTADKDVGLSGDELKEWLDLFAGKQD